MSMSYSCPENLIKMEGHIWNHGSITEWKSARVFYSGTSGVFLLTMTSHVQPITGTHYVILILWPF